MHKNLWVLILLTLISCSRNENTSLEHAPSMAAPAKMSADGANVGAQQALAESAPPVASATSEIRKYIALRHQINVEVPAENMQKGFDEALKHCEALKCQILTANYNKETPYSPPSASLNFRIPPANVEEFLGGLAKSGEILQHMREAEDKTNQVIDTDARIKNLTELRDRLRAMLSDKSAKFKDIIDVERELANTQSQLDSYLSMRKVLSLETDFVAMNIDFTAKQGISEQGFFSPVARALKDAGHVLMESIATLITFFVTVLPWLVLGVPALILMRKLWNKIRTKQQTK